MYGYDNEPPAPRRPVYTCDECGAGIHDGAPYYYVYGQYYCERCMEGALHYASEDDLVIRERTEDIA